MNPKIGDKEIVFTGTFIIPHDETVEFTFSPTHPEPAPMATYNKMSLNVKLKYGPEGELVKAEWGGTGTANPFVMITLPELESRRIGPAIMGKPVRIGEVSGKTLGFYVAFSSPGEHTLVTLQFVLGGNYE
jgi:hypothetical protein